MPPDRRFDRLLELATPRDPGALDEASLPPEAFQAWRSGGLRFGRFILMGELGRGGTGIVYRAWQHDLRREVALKVVTGLNPELRERFMREAGGAVRVMDFGLALTRDDATRTSSASRGATRGSGWASSMPRRRTSNARSWWTRRTSRGTWAGPA